MDSLINASARALAAGDALGALKHVALRNDAPALALRGIAMAQLGDLARARELLRRAARGFGQGEPLAHARCVAATNTDGAGFAGWRFCVLLFQSAVQNHPCPFFRVDARAGACATECVVVGFRRWRGTNTATALRR